MPQVKVDTAATWCYIVHIMDIIPDNPAGSPRIPLKCAGSPRTNFAGSLICTAALTAILLCGGEGFFRYDPFAMLAALLAVIGVFDAWRYRADAFRPKPRIYIDRQFVEFGDDFTLSVSFKRPPENLKLNILRGCDEIMSFNLTRPEPETALKLAIPASEASGGGRWRVQTSGWSFRLPVIRQKTIKPKLGENIPDVILETQLVNNMKGLD